MAGRSGAYDAFLSHNSADKPLVKEIGRWLEDEARLRVWLDEWNLVPGEPWQEELEKALDESKCCVVFLGASGLGAWQNEEMRAALDERVAHGMLRVVPVLLHGAHRPQKESELPPFLRRLTWVRFGQDWKDETALHRLRCGIRGIPPGSHGGDFVEVCPYRGLEVFRPEDQRFFFGRDALVERLLDHLERHRFLAVVGPSGSGKSSAVLAGLVPELEGGDTLVEVLTPRERPLEELAFALRRCFPKDQAPPIETLLGRLRTSSEALHLIARELAEAKAATRIFLVVDQFEEIFTQTADDDERWLFVTSLLGAMERSGPTSVILTMRSDFLGHCAVDPDLNVFVNDHLEQIAPMSHDELESAILDPARLVGLVFEDGLAEEILDDVKGSPGELPLLQHALLELYERRDGARLTLRSYQKIGRIEGSLARRAEEEFKKLDGLERETLRKMFVLCLVRVGEGTEDTRRRAVREELLAVGEDPRIAASVLAQWTDARLLTTQSDEARDHELVDVAHEALIRKWARLETWMAEGREAARLVNVLRQAANEWQRDDFRHDFLFRGARLAQAKELLASHGRDLTKLERSFVATASARARRRLRLVGASVFIALAVAGYLVYDSNKSKNEAQLSQDAALRQLALNYWNEGRTQRSQGNLLHSLHFIAEAIAISPDAALRESQLIDVERFQPTWALSEVLEHQERVWGALFSGDESRVLTWSYDNTARLSDAASGEAIGRPLEHQDEVRGAVFSGDDSSVLTWSIDGTARVWDAATAEATGPPLEHQDSVRGALFSGDDSSVLTWSIDGTARLWDAATGEAIGSPMKHLDVVKGAVFSGDNSRVLTWSQDHTARLWDAATGEATGRPLEHQHSVLGAVFSGDGRRVLTWSYDGTARLWVAATGEAIGLPMEHQGMVEGQGGIEGALFSGDGRRVLTWGNDGTAKLWNALTGQISGRPLDHQDRVWEEVWIDDDRVWEEEVWIDDGDDDGPGPPEPEPSVLNAVFSGDDSRVLTRSSDGTVRLWNAATGEAIDSPLLHQDSVNGAVFTSDESRVLTWSSDGTAQFWNATSGEAVGFPLEHQDPVWEAALSSDDSRLLTWSSDGTVRLWNAATGEAASPVFEPQGGRFYSAVFSGDESRVLTWNDGTAQLWDAATGEAIGPPLVHQDSVKGAVFSGDGRRVLTWSRVGTARLLDAATDEAIGPALEALEEDPVKVVEVFSGEARLWDAATGEAIGPPLVHQDEVWGAVFSGDDTRVLTWSDNRNFSYGIEEMPAFTDFRGRGQVWDAATGETIGPALEHQGKVFGAVFNGDDTRVLTWSSDHTARLWDAATGETIGSPLEHLGEVRGAVFSGDDTRALTWGEDNTARLWDTATGLAIGPP
ncbi:MAG: TIR domain-containing protein, partial [bacterium]|nr:TIR domain-containing protein [bacterium]